MVTDSPLLLFSDRCSVTKHIPTDNKSLNKELAIDGLCVILSDRSSIDKYNFERQMSDGDTVLWCSACLAAKGALAGGMTSGPRSPAPLELGKSLVLLFHVGCMTLSRKCQTTRHAR